MCELQSRRKVLCVQGPSVSVFYLSTLLNRNNINESMVADVENLSSGFTDNANVILLNTSSLQPLAF